MNDGQQQSLDSEQQISTGPKELICQYPSGSSDRNMGAPAPRLSHRLLASACYSLQRYLPVPPCPTRKQAHGHPCAALAVSVKTATPGNGRTGPNESRYCCCGSSGYSCYGWRNAGSAEYCSRHRPESRAGFVPACSLTETHLAEYHLPQPRCLGMTGMANPALYRGIQRRPVYLSVLIHTAHVS